MCGPDIRGEYSAYLQGGIAVRLVQARDVLNGVRTMVPTHIVPGVRAVALTEDDSYVQRAKD